MIRYEYLMEPYDPIDITNHEFMGGLAVNMNVGAVAKVAVIFAISTDDSDMWDDYDNRSSTNQAMTYRSRLKQSHETSQLRTQITLTVVDKTGEEIYSETCMWMSIQIKLPLPMQIYRFRVVYHRNCLNLV